jgi:hypothetical protein
MESSEHAVLGGVVSAVGVSLLRGRSLAARLALFVYGLSLSVFIDLDHFAWARRQAGDWSHLVRAVTNPTWAFTEQEAVFEDVDVRQGRLLSHALIGGATTLALWTVSPAVAVYNAVVVYVHVVADLLRDAELA